jgi:hypothetical protein
MKVREFDFLPVISFGLRLTQCRKRPHAVSALWHNTALKNAWTLNVIEASE